MEHIIYGPRNESMESDFHTIYVDAPQHAPQFSDETKSMYKPPVLPPLFITKDGEYVDTTVSKELSKENVKVSEKSKDNAIETKITNAAVNAGVFSGGALLTKTSLEYITGFGLYQTLAPVGTGYANTLGQYWAAKTAAVVASKAAPTGLNAVFAGIAYAGGGEMVAFLTAPTLLGVGVAIGVGVTGQKIYNYLYPETPCDIGIWDVWNATGNRVWNMAVKKITG